jgi:hypothetical protein
VRTSQLWQSQAPGVASAWASARPTHLGWNQSSHLSHPMYFTWSSHSSQQSAKKKECWLRCEASLKAHPHTQTPRTFSLQPSAHLVVFVVHGAADAEDLVVAVAVAVLGAEEAAAVPKRPPRGERAREVVREPARAHLAAHRGAPQLAALPTVRCRAAHQRLAALHFLQHFVVRPRFVGHHL